MSFCLYQSRSDIGRQVSVCSCKNAPCAARSDNHLMQLLCMLFVSFLDVLDIRRGAAEIGRVAQSKDIRIPAALLQEAQAVRDRYTFELTQLFYVLPCHFPMLTDVCCTRNAAPRRHVNRDALSQFEEILCIFAAYAARTCLFVWSILCKRFHAGWGVHTVGEKSLS